MRRQCCRARARPGRLRVGYGVLLRRQGSNHMRLSFCYPTPERIREGVRRLSTVVNAEKEMVDMFGTASTDEAGAGSAR